MVFFFFFFFFFFLLFFLLTSHLTQLGFHIFHCKFGRLNQNQACSTNNIALKQDNGWKLEILDLISRGSVTVYYPCSENKGADQLPSYCKADLHLCFRIQRLVFS